MVHKTIRVSADRFASLKAAKEAAGCKTMGQYLERLAAGSLAPQGVPEAEIEREVERRLKARLTEPEVARMIGLEVERLADDRMDRFLADQPALDHVLMDANRRTLNHEDAARVLIDRLPEATKNFAYEICESVLHITPSQLIHGHLMAAADAGRLQAPLIDPSWDTGGGPQIERESVCEWGPCRQSFTPQRHGQRFCSNVCGGKAATAMLPTVQPNTRPILEEPGMQNLIAV
jgi:hypothetical protein